MYDSDNLKCMINCLEEYGYAYTKYEHSNGYCTINSDLLLKQLKLNEQEIRAKAIDEFAERLKEKYGCLGYIDEITFEEVDEIADQMKAGAE